MKQALIYLDEIKRMQQAISKTKSYKLQNDYRKAIKRKQAELKEYCKYKNINLKVEK
jgi:hypothetical protein